MLLLLSSWEGGGEGNVSTDTRIKEMRAEQEELVRRFNDFSEHIGSHHAEDETMLFVNFLDHHVLINFRNEEKYMELSGYPASFEHIRKHEDFKTILSSFKEDVLQKGLKKHLILKLHKEVQHWIRKHIRIIDKSPTSYNLPKNKIKAKEPRKK